MAKFFGYLFVTAGIIAIGMALIVGMVTGHDQGIMGGFGLLSAVLGAAIVSD